MAVLETTVRLKAPDGAQVALLRVPTLTVSNADTLRHDGRNYRFTGGSPGDWSFYEFGGDVLTFVPVDSSWVIS